MLRATVTNYSGLNSMCLSDYGPNEKINAISLKGDAGNPDAVEPSDT